MFPMIACLPWHYIMPPPISEKDWYIGTLLRAIKAGIENTNQLLKNLSRLPKKCLGYFMRDSTVLQYS